MQCGADPVDMQVRDMGSIIQFRAGSTLGSEWLARLEDEGWQWLGSWLNVDRRLAAVILDAMHDDGLAVEEVK